MKQFNAEQIQIETASALGTVMQAEAMHQYPAYIGLDVHKENIVVAVARAGRSAPESWGEIANKPKAITKLVKRLNEEFDGEVLLFYYEAGPCGYVVYRQLLELSHDCQVVAPSLIPKKPGERIKTDRRDAGKLARSLRSGDLTAVWVPDEEQEAMRDLTRTPARTSRRRSARPASSSTPMCCAMATPGPRTGPAGPRRTTTVTLSNPLNCAQPPAKATIFNCDKIISDSLDFVKTNITPLDNTGQKHLIGPYLPCCYRVGFRQELFISIKRTGYSHRNSLR